MTETGPVRLVCFDLGGVLLRICRSWAEACAVVDLPVHCEPELVADTDIYRAHVAHQVGTIGTREFAERMSRAMDGYSADEVERVHAAWVHGEYDGVGEVIASIHAAGVETAALSNTSPDHWRDMPKFPAVMALGRRFASHEIEARKPDAEAYAVVEHETGFAGAEILFFDDLPENIDAARARGWRAIAVDPMRPTDAQISAGLLAHGITAPSASTS